MQNPLVSVGAPVFNAERFLSQTLACISKQDYDNIEIIISDNGSSDKTREIILSHAEHDPRIKYFFHNENKGAAWNYNFVFEKTSGDYFKWAAYDDLFANNYISKCIKAFEKKPEAVLVYGKTLLLNGNNDFYAYYDDNLHLTLEKPHQRLFRLLEILARCNPVFGLMKKQVMKKTGLIGPYISSDRVFLAEMAMLGQFIELPEFLFFRRMHNEISTSANKSNSELLNWFKVDNKESMLSKFYSIFPQTNLYLQHLLSIIRLKTKVKEKLLCFNRLNKAFFHSQKTSTSLNQRIATFNQEKLCNAFVEIVKDINNEKLEPAFNTCNEILEYIPWQAEILHFRASIFYKSNDFNTAREDIEKALLIKPNEPSFNNTAGLIYKSLNENITAMNFYNKALQIKPDYKEALYNKDILSGLINELSS